MTQVPPAAPTQNPASPPSFQEGEAMDAARARLDAEFPQATPPGAPAAPAGDAEVEIPEGVDIFDDDAIDEMLAAEQIPYRDGARLKKQMLQTREQFRPVRDALAGLDDEQRSAFLEAAPTLGGDLAVLARTSARLHPDDRAFFANAMELLASGDPESIAQGADMLARGADAIRGTASAPAAAPAPPQSSWETPPPDPAAQPITQADLQQALAAEREQARDQQRQARLLEEIRADARELGYDPDALQGTPEFRQFENLIGIASREKIDIKQAHEIIDGDRQRIIDEYVQAKSVGADTPAMPVGAGGAPTNQQPLETPLDALGAMRARLEGVLGPDPRARTHDG